MDRPVRVLALDLATSTGWAAYGPGLPLTYGRYQLPECGHVVGRFLHHFDLWFSDLITEYEPRVIFYEAPWIGPRDTVDKLQKNLGLPNIVEMVCWRREVGCFKLNVRTVRAHFLGKGNLKRADAKRQAVARCKALGLAVASDDEADAIALLDCALARWDWPRPWAEAEEAAE